MAEILSGTKFSAQGGPASGWKCAFCGGTGVQPHSLKSHCLACRGKGEVEFKGPAITCPPCKGTGKAPNSSTLSCLRCKGIGVIEKGEAADVLGERLGEIVKRLSWTRKETKKKTREVEKRLKPIKPFIKEVKKETLWLEKLGNKIKEEWKSLWEQ